LNLCGIYSILKGTERLDISAGAIPATTPRQAKYYRLCRLQ
jgi:hypothetical protein